MKTISGGVTAAQGFLASATRAGIKYKRPDMALLFSSKPARIAGMFTTNRIQGAHVTLCRKHIRSGRAQAVVVNSGCANACVGPRGLKDAMTMASFTARLLDLPVTSVLPCSTGTIGILMPMDKIKPGIEVLCRTLRKDGGPAAARAIMTTDTHDKQCAVEVIIDGCKVRVGGMAKGAGMIEPNMATMLAYVTTDAAVSGAALQSCLKTAVNESFNKISVDGDQSCNDTIFLMANGLAGNRPLNTSHRQWPVFESAVRHVCSTLAKSMVKDGEGATKFVTVRVRGAANPSDARKAVRAITRSLLVKTSWFGGDPNWGRIIDAAGYSGAQVREERVEICFDGIRVVKNGCKVPDFPLRKLEKVYAQKAFTVDVNLHLGRAEDVVFTCDCSYEYVKINSEYMT